MLMIESKGEKRARKSFSVSNRHECPVKRHAHGRLCGTVVNVLTRGPGTGGVRPDSDL